MRMKKTTMNPPEFLFFAIFLITFFIIFLVIFLTTFLVTLLATLLIISSSTISLQHTTQSIPLSNIGHDFSCSLNSY